MIPLDLSSFPHLFFLDFGSFLPPPLLSFPSPPYPSREYPPIDKGLFTSAHHGARDGAWAGVAVGIGAGVCGDQGSYGEDSGVGDVGLGFDYDNTEVNI